MFNIINGGVHARWRSFRLSGIHDLAIPERRFKDALRWGSEIYHTLLDVLKSEGQYTGVGDEGGFVRRYPPNREPLDYIFRAIEKAGYEPGKDVGIAIDAASSGFYQDGLYVLRTEGRQLTTQEMVTEYTRIMADYPVFLLEDGLSEDDWEGC